MALSTQTAIGDALSAATDALSAAGVQTPRLDAELMLVAASGMDRTRFATDPELSFSAAAAREFGAMVRRRVQREPVAYILGSKGFRHLSLSCDRRALIPRPETELLVEVAVALQPGSVLDVGTGTGAVALAVADEIANAAVHATDTSPEALALARENAASLGVAERLSFEAGTLPARPASFDLVLANLPYVPDAEWATLAPEITKYEPREAILGGPDGLGPIRSLLEAVSPDTHHAIGLEVGQGQAAEVAELVQAAGFPSVERRADLAGIERVVLGAG